MAMTKLEAARRLLPRAASYHVGAKIRWRRLRRSVSPLLAAGAPRVLDAGSGNGEHTFRLARRYPQATFHGVELDATHVTDCQTRLQSEPLPNLTFARGDLTLPLGRDAYDLVYSVDVLEHIADDRAVLANMARALRPGGNLLIHTPLTPQRHWLRRFDLDRCGRDDHIREGYGEAELRDNVSGAGLVPTQVWYTHGRWGTLAWELWKLAGWRLLPRLLLWPLAMFLIGLETVFPPAWGNCIFLEARRPEVS